MADKPGLTTSLRHRDFRLLMAALTASTIGSWAYSVALAVWIFNETGSAGWVGASTIGRFIPALLFSAYGGVLAERFERVRLMVRLDVVAGLVMVSLAVEVAIQVPVILAIATSAVVSTIATIYEPATAALTPQLVGERDLGSANTLRNTIDNVAVIAGPGLGALLLLAGPPWVAVAINATSYAISALLTARIRARSKPVDVTEGGDVGPLRQMLVGAKAIFSSRTAAALVSYSLLATFIFGVDTVQLIVLSRDVLGTGAEGYGYLLAGLGLGGVLVAGVVTRLERLPRLGPVILTGMALYTVPTLLFLFVESPEVGFAVEVIRGAGTLAVDVLAVTALQRSLPNDLLARVFGAFNASLLGAILLGALAAPLVIDTWGLRTSIWLAGAAIPVASLAGWPVLRAMDRDSATRRAALEPRRRLLAACDLFESVSEGGLDELSGGAEELDVAVGATVVREGEDADAFYVIVHGLLGVTAVGEAAAGVTLGSMGDGEYFGEIGLIEQVPRTATVTAIEPSRLLRIDGQDFLAALTESTPSPALLEGASLRLSRTHPSRRLTSAGLPSSSK
ncbi:MAG: MFS transporter [Nocardioidaceae bacterium]